MGKGSICAIFAASSLAISPAAAAAQDIKAQAIFKSGQQLLDQCTSSSADAVSACDWYIMGVWDAFGLMADLEVTERYMCVADGTAVEALRANVIDYLQRGGTDLSKSAVSNVINAIIEKNPC